MQTVTCTQTQEYKNSESCTVYEYPLEDKDINGAVAHINGRYPEYGCATNTVCKELAYVMSGSGKITINNNETLLNQGDMILINPGEKFYWDGAMTLFLSCTPAWYPEQHKVELK